MAWLRVSDNYATDPVLMNVCRTRGDKTKVLGWIVELMLYSASHLTDGYIPELIFRDIVRSPKWREALTSPAGGGTALVHKPGDKCACMVNPVAWPDTAADYYLHHYLMWNPSREENDVARAKAAELRDRELLAIVRKRDLGRCRYCAVAVVWADRRSSLGGVYDHVDPAIAAGAANLVVACRGCNSRKGHRTPDAAGMTLLPVPGSAPGPADLSRDQLNAGAGDPTQTSRSGADTTTRVPVRDGTGRASQPSPPPTSGDQGGSASGVDVAGPADPRGPWSPGPGDQPTTGPPSTPRTSRHPNPYLRPGIRAPDPRDHAGLPMPEAIDAALSEYNAFTESEDDP
jgi:5-methylcytosine-specific restriction endonuclease McrA